MASFIFPAAALLLSVSSASAQVTATGTNGVTNPAQPTLGAYNQTSMSRLVSLNSYDDFCIYAPPTPGDTIGDTEGEEVAWCTKPRNGARLIPDGTITAAHFVKTPLYVQITGFGNLTALNIMDGDEGGELDPHGATGLGNPVGGNVTSNVTGSDVFYEEWMNYVSYNSFCLRICTDANSTYSAAIECQHTFDLMGCEWVMPGDYTENSFTSCEGDSAYPPGVYPINDTATSTFAQRYTNTAVGNQWTIGDTVTPQTPYSTPASSNCITYSTISNGVTDIVSAATVAIATGSASGSSQAASGASASSAAVATSMSSAVSGAASSSESASSANSASASSKSTGSSKSSTATASIGAAAASASTSTGTSSGSRTAGGFPIVSTLAAFGLGLLGVGAVLL